MSSLPMTVARRPLTLLPAVVCLLLAGCSSSDGAPNAPGPGLRTADVRFFVQTEVPDAVMDALFEGRVILDAAGCPRLGTPDGPTMVWPFGYRLASEDGALVVRDAEGSTVGRIGGSFRLGGGEAPLLHDGIPLDPVDRGEAVEHCPGRYWIAGEDP